MIKPFSQPIYVTRPILPSLKEYTDELKEVWSTKWLSNDGHKQRKLEAEIKKELRMPYASLFNNGTSALLLAIKCLDLTGEVITTPFTFPATPNCLYWNGIQPVFCDIDPVTLNIDPDKIESLITKKTTGILGVHVFGTPCDVEKIDKIAKKHKLKIIYDAAHAFGSDVNGKPIGMFGDISMFSFHPTKLYHTGEGGALVYKDRRLKKKADFWRNFGIHGEEEVVLPGINAKMNELQAAMGLVVKKHIGAERRRRRIIKHIYVKKLSGLGGVQIVTNRQKGRESLQYFVIRIDAKKFGLSRDQVYNEFLGFNVFTRKYFYPLCSDYPYFKYLPSSNKKNLPVANKVVNEVLSMPFYGELKNSDIEKVCELLISFKKDGSAET
jgi:dTDP-4-amino-4,6-dideoxygalactose transaminase